MTILHAPPLRFVLQCGLFLTLAAGPVASATGLFHCEKLLLNLESMECEPCRVDLLQKLDFKLSKGDNSRAVLLLSLMAPMPDVPRMAVKLTELTQHLSLTSIDELSGQSWSSSQDKNIMALRFAVSGNAKNLKDFYFKAEELAGRTMIPVLLAHDDSFLSPVALPQILRLPANSHEERATLIRSLPELLKGAPAFLFNPKSQILTLALPTNVKPEWESQADHRETSKRASEISLNWESLEARIHLEEIELEYESIIISSFAKFEGWQNRRLHWVGAIDQLKDAGWIGDEVNIEADGQVEFAFDIANVTGTDFLLRRASLFGPQGKLILGPNRPLVRVVVRAHGERHFPHFVVFSQEAFAQLTPQTRELLYRRAARAASAMALPSSIENLIRAPRRDVLTCDLNGLCTKRAASLLSDPKLHTDFFHELGQLEKPTLLVGNFLGGSDFRWLILASRPKIKPDRPAGSPSTSTTQAAPVRLLSPPPAKLRPKLELIPPVAPAAPLPSPPLKISPSDLLLQELRGSVKYSLQLTKSARSQIDQILESNHPVGLGSQLRKALQQLAKDPRYPGLNSHIHTKLTERHRKTIYSSYVQKAPSARRIIWRYVDNSEPTLEVIGVARHGDPEYD